MIEERIELIDTALGNTNADVVIIGGNLVNVFTREIYKANVLIKGKRIAAVLDSNQPVPPGAKIIHADGEFIAPGFIDPHMHLESSNLTLTEFAKAVMVRGVTTIAIDPHEICNVLGVRGIALLMEEAKQIPLNVFLRVPPRVPEYPS